MLDLPSKDLHIRKWLSFILENKVEHVVLHSVFRDMYTLPQLFYTCSSLITFDLSNCAFEKGAVISWKSLKTLKFDTVVLDDETSVKLLSGCPALETMELTSCYSFRHLEINNSNLKRLKLEGVLPMNEGGERSFEIIAPYLQQLEIIGGIHDIKCRLVNVSSLVSAPLNFFIACVSQLDSTFVYVEDDSCHDHHQVFWTLIQDYLQKVSHVMELTIATWFAEVLFMPQLDEVLLPELKCKCLTLKLHITKYNLYGVASLLQASPHMETLNIDMESGIILSLSRILVSATAMNQVVCAKEMIMIWRVGFQTLHFPMSRVLSLSTPLGCVMNPMIGFSNFQSFC
ncbi:F-box/LRR-repeat protein At3g03360-like isoform X2 [Nicotiana sylvestris]|uniref:F-box/LRR-repeat protein At3g03360-like isoform X2 n=1 Tax=Nicotiana sylvestris TaxID=4096 RepID=UPI00388CAB36